jgi:hypothetical protein
MYRVQPRGSKGGPGFEVLRQDYSRRPKGRSLGDRRGDSDAVGRWAMAQLGMAENQAHRRGVAQEPPLPNDLKRVRRGRLISIPHRVW